MSKNEAQNRVGIFWQNPIFWAETFFQRPLENFLLALRTCSRYLKGPLNLALCVSKKIVIIRHTNEKILAKKTPKNSFCMTSLGTTVVLIWVWTLGNSPHLVSFYEQTFVKLWCTLKIRWQWLLTKRFMFTFAKLKFVFKPKSLRTLPVVSTKSTPKDFRKVKCHQRFSN